MGAYTPGLKVTEATLLHLERRLPLEGEVLVSQGDKVTWNQVVARTELPGRVDMLNVANKLGIDPAEVPESLLVKVGTDLEKGAPLAQNQGFFGWFRSTLRTPMKGNLESASAVTGQVVLRAPPNPVELNAYADGIVEEVLPGQGVIIKTFGTYIQGIFGIGGETAGKLVVLGDEQLSKEHQGKVVVGGALASHQFIEAAVDIGVAGLIVGGIHDQDLRRILGYDLGVAITGSERIGLTIIVTEGFGPIPIADRTMGLLKQRQGELASISGATQIRAGVIRPEIIIPRLEGDWTAAEERSLDLELAVGVPVRLIRQPHFGSLATVTELPVQPQEVPSGARVRVAKVKLDDGEEMTLPRANLELIEG